MILLKLNTSKTILNVIRFSFLLTNNGQDGIFRNCIKQRSTVVRHFQSLRQVSQCRQSTGARK